jgi:hypothetical protein
MKLENIRKEILENNNWLNGWYDYKDGDLMALVNVDDYVPNIIELKTVKTVAKYLKKYDGVSIKYKNLIFMQHWNYACFVYRLPNLKGYFEHLSTHHDTYTEQEIIKDIKNMCKEVRK